MEGCKVKHASADLPSVRQDQTQNDRPKAHQLLRADGTRVARLPPQRGAAIGAHRAVGCGRACQLGQILRGRERVLQLGREDRAEDV